MFTFSVTAHDYDNDFMFFLVPSLEPVLEGKTLRFSGATPLDAYTEFRRNVQIGGYFNSDVIKNPPSGYGHVKYFQNFFDDLLRKLSRYDAKVRDTGSYCSCYINDMEISPTGEFTINVGGNYELCLQMQEVIDSAPDTSMDEQIRNVIASVKSTFLKDPKGTIQLTTQEAHYLCQLAELALGPRCG